MEKTRTLYRLRRMKNGVLMNLFTLMAGVSLFVVLVSFESSIMSMMRERATGLLNNSESLNINASLELCDKAFDYLKIASIISILFALEGLVMVFFFVRMSSQTWKLSKFSPTISGIGTLLLSVYFLFYGIGLPSSGHANLDQTFGIVKYLGVFFILIANILFVYQVFIQVVLEKFDE